MGLLFPSFVKRLSRHSNWHCFIFVCFFHFLFQRVKGQADSCSTGIYLFILQRPFPYTLSVFSLFLFIDVLDDILDPVNEEEPYQDYYNTQDHIDIFLTQEVIGLVQDSGRKDISSCDYYLDKRVSATHGFLLHVVRQQRNIDPNDRTQTHYKAAYEEAWVNGIEEGDQPSGNSEGEHCNTNCTLSTDSIDDESDEHTLNNDSNLSPHAHEPQLLSGLRSAQVVVVGRLKHKRDKVEQHSNLKKCHKLHKE